MRVKLLKKYYINTEDLKHRDNDNSLINLKDFLNNKVFIKNFNGNNNSTIDIDISSKINTVTSLDGQSFLVVIYGAHYNSNHHTLVTYILRTSPKEDASNLYQVYKSQASNVNLSASYNKDTKKISITNDGSYGAKCTLIII